MDVSRRHPFPCPKTLPQDPERLRPLPVRASHLQLRNERSQGGTLRRRVGVDLFTNWRDTEPKE